MNKKVRGFILVTLALSIGFLLTAQSPTFPLIQGRVLSGGKIVPVQVDKNGVVQVSSGGGGGGCTAPCVVIGNAASGAVPSGAPVLVAGQDGTDVRTLLTDPSGREIVVGQAAVGAAAGNPFTEGTRDDSNNTLAIHSCPDQAAVTLSSGTDVTIIAGVSAKKIYICHLDLASSAAANMTIRQGTQMSTPCDTTTTALTGAYQNVVSFASDYSAWSPFHTPTAALDVCLHFSTSVTIGGWVTYAQY